MKVYYRDDPCGVGKTRAELIHVATDAGHYVLAVDRRAAIPDRIVELMGHIRDAGTVPAIKVLCSDEIALGLPAAVEIARTALRASVTAEIAALPETLWAVEHVIVVITHEGLRQSDLSGFAGWHLVIDEAPSAWECASEVSPALYRHLEAAYTLEPIEPHGWSRVRARDDLLSLGDIRADHTLARWADFHKRVVSRRGVVVSVRDWSEVCSRRSWCWWSVWSPRELDAFETVTICAHAFTHSVTAKLWKANWPEIEWERVATPSERTWEPRKVTIRYAAHHEAGTYFWAQKAGRECLTAWAAWIASLHPRDSSTRHLFACNEANRDLLTAAGIGGHHPTIRVAGSNQWADVHDVSLAYAAKASPHEGRILAELGVTLTEVTQAREYEDLVQFVMRSSLRDPASTTDVRINLYDVRQAEVVATYLRRHYPFKVVVEHVDIGISSVTKPRRGRPETVVTDEQREAMMARRRERRTAAQRLRRRKAWKALPLATEADAELVGEEQAQTPGDVAPAA